MFAIKKNYFTNMVIKLFLPKVIDITNSTVAFMSGIKTFSIKKYTQMPVSW